MSRRTLWIPLGRCGPVLLLLLAAPQVRAAIDVLSATYGGNCGVAQNNLIATLAAGCNGKDECRYIVDYQVVGDPAPGCAKDFVAQWRCGTADAPRTVSLPGEAGFRSIAVLTCPVKHFKAEVAPPPHGLPPAAIEMHPAMPEAMPPPPPPPPVLLPPNTGAEPPLGVAYDSAPPNFAVMKVFFATDRNDRKVESPSKRFGIDRSEMSYGSCLVSIPHNHKPGELEGPSIWKLEFHADPEKHVVLLHIDTAPEKQVFAELAAQIGATKSASTLVFVHGYNVSFEDAARRTAQIAHDMYFDGVPVFYSWPSKATTAGYMEDEATVEWTQVHLQKFLADVIQRSEAKNIYLIAHSMGNRALTRAFVGLVQENPSLAARVKELVLTAPDIDAQVFREQIAPGLVKLGTPVTLYASSRDLALEASEKVHGYARAGDVGERLVIAPGIDTIDASAVDTSLLGHSYVGDSVSVLHDLANLFTRHQRAIQRDGLEEVMVAQGRYWQLNP